VGLPGVWGVERIELAVGTGEALPGPVASDIAAGAWRRITGDLGKWICWPGGRRRWPRYRLSARASERPRIGTACPLPGVQQEKLVRERECTACGMRYAIFREHRFCPVCGRLPAIGAAMDSLDAEAGRLDAFDAIPPYTRAALREQGVVSGHAVAHAVCT
jgi:hypothetical protein